MTGFTPWELEELKRVDAQIEEEFFHQWQEESKTTPDLVWVSRLAREAHTTYGKFVSAHKEEELRTLVEQRREKGEISYVPLQVQHPPVL